MNKAEAIGFDLGRTRISGLTLGIGILVTLLMVISGFSGAFIAGTVANRAAASTSQSAHATSAVASSPHSSTSVAKPLASSASYADRLQLQRSILGNLHAQGVPNKYIELPNFMGTYGPITQGVGPANVIAPSPMGLGDYGVMNTTGTAVPYTYNTSSFQATTTLNSINPFYLLNDGPDSFGMQLNTVLYNVTVGNSTMNGTAVNDFWTQNVPSYTVSSHQLFLIDNVWNFSNANTRLPAGSLIGNGTLVAPTFYYDVYPAPTTQGINVAPPFTLTLYNNASTASGAVSPWKNISTENNFGFTLTSPNTISYPNATGVYKTTHALSVVYDKVFFKSTSKAGTLPTPQYSVSGKTCALKVGTFCIPDDAEITTAIGPGGGSTTNVYGINSTLQLKYWAGSAYVNVKSAWDTGSETGETVQGVSEWWTTPGVVNLGPGPSVIFPLWNASGLISTSGAIKVTAKVDPSNAFVFVTPPGVPTDPGNMSWAPGPMSGDMMTYNLPLVKGAVTTYKGVAEFANYNPASITIIKATTSITVSLTKNVATGIYTPLQAFNNAQLANISASGSGTPASPYLLYSDSVATLNASFCGYNDYGFPSFAGTLLDGTTLYANANGTQTWNINYASPWLAFMVKNKLPTSNQLAFETYGASHVSVWGSPSLTGWYLPPLYGVTGMPFANVLLWNTTASLVGNNVFVNTGTASLLVYNAPQQTGGNFVWGNTFTNNLLSTADPTGVELYTSGNTIYNNNVQTTNTASAGTYDIYNGGTRSLTNVWNVSSESSTVVMNVNGYSLTGNILGQNWQGGNDWNNYNCGAVVPYNNGGGIAKGGDYLPLSCVPTPWPLTFSQSGLPTGTSWKVSLSSGQVNSSTTGTDIIHLFAGTYTYTVSTAVTGYAVEIGKVIAKGSATGSVTIAGAATVSVTFLQVGAPSTALAVPSALKNNVTAGQTNLNFVVSSTFAANAASNLTESFLITSLNPSGMPGDPGTCAYGAWFATTASKPAATWNVLVSVTNLTSLLNFCFPAGDRDLAYGAFAATVYVNATDANTGISSTVSSASKTFFHIYSAVTGPSPGSQFSAGNVTISYGLVWAEASAIQLVVAGPTNFSKVVVDVPSGQLSGTLQLYLTIPGSYTATLNLDDSLLSSTWPLASYNTSTSFSVVQQKTPVLVVYKNSTVTQTLTPLGISTGILTSMLIVVGIAVGAILGYVLLRPKAPGGPRSSTPKEWQEPGQPKTP